MTRKIIKENGDVVEYIQHKRGIIRRNLTLMLKIQKLRLTSKK